MKKPTNEIEKIDDFNIKPTYQRMAKLRQLGIEEIKNS